MEAPAGRCRADPRTEIAASRLDAFTAISVALRSRVFDAINEHAVIAEMEANS